MYSQNKLYLKDDSVKIVLLFFTGSDEGRCLGGFLIGV